MVKPQDENKIKTCVLLFWESVFSESMQNHSRTPKTCFTLGLESLWHIYSYKTALKVARGAPMIGREKSIEEQTK